MVIIKERLRHLQRAPHGTRSLARSLRALKAAAAGSISEETVKAHVKKIRSKPNADDRTRPVRSPSNADHRHLGASGQSIG